MSIPAAVVDVGWVNGLAAIRSLGRAGIRVLAVDHRPSALGFRSKYAERLLCPDPFEDEHRFVNVVRHGAKSYAAIIEKLQPTWIVLRPGEATRPEFTIRPVLRDYTLVKSWDVLPRLDAISMLPGRKWNELEARYQVYRRNPAPAAGR